MSIDARFPFGEQPACAATSVGAWDNDVLTRRFFVDPVMAKLFGIDPQDRVQGTPETAFLGAFHPFDRIEGGKLMKRLTREGGSFVFEHRIAPAHGRERWILARGRYVKDDQGAVVRGRGIVIDITSFKAVGYADGSARFMRPEDRGGDPVNRNGSSPKNRLLYLLEMAEHLVAAHRLARNNHDEAATATIETAMFHVGQTLRGETETALADNHKQH